MMNYFIPEDFSCVECNEVLEEFDKGTFDSITWYTYKCTGCEEIYTDEPDYDSIFDEINDY